MVQRCFTVLDVDGSGQVDSKDLKGVFNSKEHPDVIAGKKTEDQVLCDFLNNFDGTQGNNDGVLTLNEF